MTGHPDADALAACREGLLGRRRSARIRGHLARCSRCASVDRGLAEVTALLASAPAPRMPDELAARLDAVLAAESAARGLATAPAPADGAGPDSASPDSASPDSASPDSASPDGAGGGARRRDRGFRPDRSRPGGSRPGRPPRRWRVTALRAASVTAAVLVIAGGGYGVSRLLQSGGGTTASSSAAGGTAKSPAASAGAGLRGPREGAQSGGNVSPRPGAVLPQGGMTVISSGTHYLPGRLAAQAEAVLAQHPGGRAPASIAGPGVTIAGCVRQVTGGASPALVDEARYNGQQATVIMQAPAGGQPGQVWVAGPGCHLLAHVLLPAAG